jgi:oxygen-independent coproporphyrinogen-3 oxidase
MKPVELIRKYQSPAPRYTSYPPVPEWETDSFSETTWKESLLRFWSGPEANAPAQVYIHLPYCESLCTFCACNKRITKNHGLERPYIEAVLSEWKRYVQLHGGPICVSEIHLGGGTPTFFSDDSLQQLMEGILAFVQPSEDFEMGIEVHPGVTHADRIARLAAIGFTRISIGIQDFSPFILEKINRHQTFEQTRDLVLEARKHGFHSVNFDLVYGLPFQTLNDVRHTLGKVLELRPDRIAFYGYAHVPWKSKGQRHFTENDLPEALERWDLFEEGKSLLLENGYRAIGLDHFALETDPLWEATLEKRLHRNFMGYTEQNARLLIGLGASSISESPDAYAQNHPVLEDYMQGLQHQTFPISKGHQLQVCDQYWKQRIMDLMCQMETTLHRSSDVWEPVLQRLQDMQTEGLVEIEEQKIRVTELGQAFVRSVCLMLDQRYWSAKEEEYRFSAAV